MKTPVPLFWEANLFARHSYAMVTREVTRALLRRPEIDLTLFPTQPNRIDPALPEFAGLHRFCANQKRPQPGHGRPIFVRLEFPLNPVPPPQATWVIYHPWEFSRCARASVELMNRAREIWTTSQFSRAALVRSGVPEQKIHIVPNGIDPAVFRPDGTRANIPRAKPFRFLFVGGTIFRKGVDVLLEAYGRAFTASDPVSLVIKDFGGKTIYPYETGAKLVTEFRQDPAHPDVVLSGDDRTDAGMAELYRACDVFVSSYRGEGFCLPALEAMACGLPVIVTQGGATDDFVDEQVGWRIPAKLRSIGRTVFHMPVDGEAELFDPDVAALAELLRESFRNEAERRARAGAAAERAKAWTWDGAAGKIVERCRALAE